MDAARQTVVEQLLAYPGLDDLNGVLAATLSGGDDVRYLYPPQGDMPQFVYTRLTHVTTEEVRL